MFVNGYAIVSLVVPTDRGEIPRRRRAGNRWETLLNTFGFTFRIPRANVYKQ